jgi:hypothetical protein
MPTTKSNGNRNDADDNDSDVGTTEKAEQNLKNHGNRTKNHGGHLKNHGTDHDPDAN